VCGPLLWSLHRAARKMRVLWLTPFTSCTGNAVTSERICSGLSDLGVQVTLRDVHKVCCRVAVGRATDCHAPL
jgi:hypothetical protein